MALNKNFPTSPFEILDPEIRWFPGDSMSDTERYKLMPPLVAVLREKVKEWRKADYAGATATSQSLLKWWFKTDHIKENLDGSTYQFQYYFAQREAVETIVYLYEIAKTQSPYDLMRFDSTGTLQASMFEEDWRRYVIKMATGAGKTKILALILVWSFFHKTYEESSDLARNFLVIAPNIIVLDRIRKDFDGLSIFFDDQMVPENGYDGKDWKADFQLKLHIQDQISLTQKTGNIFLTNIHRVYDRKDSTPSLDDDNLMDFFLGKRPVGATNDSRIDLGDIVRYID